MRMSFLPRTQFVLSLGVATAISVVLLLADTIYSHSFDHSYLLWNLFLAWLPFLLAVWLVRLLRRRAWSSWGGLILSVAWLIFLPNSFYMISDFIHIAEVDPNQLLYTTIMFTSFIFTGLVLGLSSLFLVHLELRKRISERSAGFWIALILLLCSVAIFIGRDLRWNSWDLIFNPAGLLFDISDRVINPDISQFFSVILPFFVLLGGMYMVVWRASRMLLSWPRTKR